MLAEGVNGLRGTRAGLRERPKADNVALAVKEMHFLPRETIEARFNLSGDEGTVIEAAGTISRGMTGMGFIYANKECLSVGLWLSGVGLRQKRWNCHTCCWSQFKTASLRSRLSSKDLR